MDELLIEDKKYVSSKRAAKITGYAKDYIGQLCREGRVPARLVGRSWYVLESAIQDHRFGNPESTQPAPGPIMTKEEPLAPVWVAPRYEASIPKELPLVNRLHVTEEEASIENDTEDTEQIVVEQKVEELSLQDSWHNWFDTVAEIAPAVQPKPIETVPTSEVDTPTESVGTETVEIEQGVEIPIHTVYQLPPEELLPRTSRYEEEGIYKEEYAPRSRSRGTRGAFIVLQLALIVFAVGATSIAVVATGYLDKYLISVSQASVITGILQYEK